MILGEVEKWSLLSVDPRTHSFRNESSSSAWLTSLNYDGVAVGAVFLRFSGKKQLKSPPFQSFISLFILVP
jgi:hypothetical protein